MKQFLQTKTKRLTALLLALMLLLGAVAMTACSQDDGKPHASIWDDDTPITTGLSVGNTQSVEINGETIPAYSGKPYAIVNGNVPIFSDAEKTTVGYESYSPLDKLGRCGVAIVSCGKDTMPAKDEDRGSISEVKPSGWVQAPYEFISGGYLYNRAHLIGWQLTAENANDRNLVTGTRYMNNEGMLPFENMIADYIHETGNHVAYRVTPIFVGNELVCRGVQMEAYSVEDDGEGICFNVFCYNVQPGVSIQYATGKSTLAGEEGVTDTETTAPEETTVPSDEPADFVLNTNSKKVHKPTCSSVAQISEHNRKEVHKSLDELLGEGYACCGSCFS